MTFSFLLLLLFVVFLMRIPSSSYFKYIIIINIVKDGEFGICDHLVWKVDVELETLNNMMKSLRK